MLGVFFVLRGPNLFFKVIKLPFVRYHMVESRSLSGSLAVPSLPVGLVFLVEYSIQLQRHLS